MTTKLDELKLDIAELSGFLQQATRQKSKDILSLEIRRLQTESSKLVEETQKSVVKGASGTVSDKPKCYEVKLDNYGWDQTKSILKLYVTLKSVHLLPKEAVICNYTENSVTLRILGLENKNYNLQINNFCEEIIPEKSSVRIKTDMVIVSCLKKVPNHWSHITGVEKRIKESKSSAIPEVKDDSNPEASLINLMKIMYQQGDDDMKREIAKAMAEGQESKKNRLQEQLPH